MVPRNLRREPLEGLPYLGCCRTKGAYSEGDVPAFCISSDNGETRGIPSDFSFGARVFAVAVFVRSVSRVLMRGFPAEPLGYLIITLQEFLRKIWPIDGVHLPYMLYVPLKR